MPTTAQDVGYSVDDRFHGNSKDILSPISLPCGRRLSNRLVKVAMYEHMSTFLGGPPNSAHLELYSRWSEGQWGMIMTGNVQVASDHLSLGRDIAVPDQLTAETVEPFRCLAGAIHGNGIQSQDKTSSRPASLRPLAIMQLCHTGRQSVNILGGRWPFVPPLAPSAVPLGSTPSTALSRLLYALAFQTPRAMSMADIDTAIDLFVKGALLAAKSGFDGVELHAAHGYLIAEFISLKTNHREDAFSARDKPLHFLYRIVSTIRTHEELPEDFVLGIKLNAADYAADNTDVSSQEERALQHVQEIASWSLVDFIEISGGDYENPEFMNTKSSGRQALFTRFSHSAMKALSAAQPQRPTEPHSTSDTGPAQRKETPLIMLTGGLRTVPLMTSVLAHNHAHLLGIGRLAVLHPTLPRALAAALADGAGDAFLHDAPPPPDISGLGLEPEPGRGRVERALLACVLAAHARVPVQLPQLVGAGAAMAWHVVMLRRATAGLGADYTVGGLAAVVRMWLWVAPDAPGAASGGLWDSWMVMGLVGLIIGLVLGGRL